MPGPVARIVVAEPWAILRRGLAGVLQRFGAVQEIDDPHGLADALRRRPAGLAVIGDAASIDLLSVVSAVDTCGGARLLVLSDHLGPAELRSLLRSGVRGVLAKNVPDDELLEGVERILAGDRVVDQRFLPLLFDEPRPTERSRPPGVGPLTAREHQVLLELARGASNRQIAEALLVGESTIKSHLGAIFTKLEVGDRYRAVGRAIELGLLS